VVEDGWAQGVPRGDAVEKKEEQEQELKEEAVRDLLVLDLMENQSDGSG